VLAIPDNASAVRNGTDTVVLFHPAGLGAGVAVPNVSVGGVLSNLTVIEWSISTFPALSRAWKVTVVTPSTVIRIAVELADMEPLYICAPVSV
jgi:hypothetical protein